MKKNSEVASMNKPRTIFVDGFDSADDILHMLKWLRMGSNFRQFIATDIETELYAQDRGAQLISIRCLRGLNYETKALKNDLKSSEVIVSQFQITFPLIVLVRGSDGNVWELDVELRYHATNMEVPESFNLRTDFICKSSNLKAHIH